MSDPRARLQMLDKVIASGSSDPFVHYAHALELRSLGDKAEALEALAGVAERFEDYAPTYLMAGQLAAELGREDEARTWCERGLKVADAHASGELQALLDTLG